MLVKKIQEIQIDLVLIKKNFFLIKYLFRTRSKSSIPFARWCRLKNGQIGQTRNQKWSWSGRFKSMNFLNLNTFAVLGASRRITIRQTNRFQNHWCNANCQKVWTNAWFLRQKLRFKNIMLCLINDKVIITVKIPTLCTYLLFLKRPINSMSYYYFYKFTINYRSLL